MVIETTSAKETFEAGYRLAQSVHPGQIYCLNGDLGVGKTVFTQGFAKGLGIEEPINSPTFTIVQEYHEGRLPLYHFDVYRIADVSEMDEIGYEEYFFQMALELFGTEAARIGTSSINFITLLLCQVHHGVAGIKPATEGDNYFAAPLLLPQRGVLFILVHIYSYYLNY